MSRISFPIISIIIGFEMYVCKETPLMHWKGWLIGRLPSLSDYKQNSTISECEGSIWQLRSPELGKKPEYQNSMNL
jgi:hypothetical protein